MKMKYQIGGLLVLVLAVILWLATSKESAKPASLTRMQLTEFNPMRDKYTGQYILLMGFVKDGSIKLKGDGASFDLSQEKEVLPVYYNGQDGIPDTFKDGAQALLEGKWTKQNGGVFYAHKITTKCASKYQQEGM